MAGSSPTNLLRLEDQFNGENSTTWGDKVDNNFELVEDAIAGMATITTPTTGDITLTTTNYAADEARMAVIKISMTLTGNVNVIVPTSVTKRYTIWNATAGAFTVTVKTSGGTGVLVSQGHTQEVFCDGTNVIYCNALDTHSATSKATPVDADEIPLIDSAASNVWKKLTWANLKATLFGSLIDISGASAGQIKFPATQNPSADANTLDDYEEGTFTGTLTGCTTSPTRTIRYVKIGGMVTLAFAGSLTGASNATTKTITGMPAALRPSDTVIFTALVSDNGGAYVVAYAELSATGVFSLFSSPGGAAFTSSGIFTVLGITLTYPL